MNAAVDTAPTTAHEVRALIAEAAAARDAGMALAELGDAERGGWYTQLLDQTIAWMAQTRQEFSANDIRDMLPADFPSQGLMGARFSHAAHNLGLIEAVGNRPSTKKNTHLKPIGLWVGIDNEAGA